MSSLHMLCQTAENEGVELAGEAGVSHSLPPDNAPSGMGVLLPPLTPCQPVEQTLAERPMRKNGMRQELWGAGGEGVGLILYKPKQQG